MALLIARLQQNIDDKVQELRKTQNKVQEHVKLVENLEKSAMALLSDSASTAQARRTVMTLDLEESLQQYQGQIRAYQEAITKLENEISQFEEQKREWEKKHGHTAI